MAQNQTKSMNTGIYGEMSNTESQEQILSKSPLLRFCNTATTSERKQAKNDSSDSEFEVHPPSPANLKFSKQLYNPLVNIQFGSFMDKKFSKQLNEWKSKNILSMEERRKAMITSKLGLTLQALNNISQATAKGRYASQLTSCRREDDSGSPPPVRSKTRPIANQSHYVEPKQSFIKADDAKALSVRRR